MDKSADRLEDGATISRAAEASVEAAAPPAYAEHNDQKADVESINSSIPPDSPIDDAGPDVAHPFNFPAEAPPYTESVSLPTDCLFAVPQTHPSPTASFVNAYPSALLAYGIPSETWLAFVSTISSFLDASVGKHAIRHAQKIAKSAGDVPKNMGKDIANHATDAVKTMGRSLKRGNPFGIIGPLISLPMGVAGRIVGGIFEVPHSVLQKVDTPRQRADVYVATANKKWFNPRKLQAGILNTVELAGLIQVSTDELLSTAKGQGQASTIQQLRVMRPWIGELELNEKNTVVELSPTTTTTESTSSKAKGKQKATGPTTGPPPPLLLSKASLWLVIVRIADDDKLAVQPSYPADVKKPLN
ncbi:Hypothetical protein R9X50_00485900 [Acrodontium crateriforme]|uniref:Uncharacterized protein n=1 Tax=Acrodontium crateriforme TaxID=150365 RepID=A0AAQ3M633_9PEZI|nr:Hypothetical protein R9X50_00485900 [Acrodontium crateriforme]